MKHKNDDKTKLNDSHGGPKCPGNCICDASNDYFVRFPKTSQELAKNTFEKWKNSPGHNENMLGDHQASYIERLTHFSNGGVILQ